MSENQPNTPSSARSADVNSPRNFDQWVVWRAEERDGKETKVPYSPKEISRRASTTDPETWSTLAHANAVRRNHTEQFDGIGFVFTERDDFTFIDLDNAVDYDTQEIAPWAQRIVDALNSYTEVSPSGTGLHIFVLAELPEDGPFKKKAAFDDPKLGPGDVEMYDRGRYSTITGDKVNGTPTTIEARPLELAKLRDELWPVVEREPPSTTPSPPTKEAELSAGEIFELARNSSIGDEFGALWRGRTDLYDDDESKCDHHLARMIAFYTGPDENSIISVFNESERGQREKWLKREDYRLRTARNALKNMTEFYTPPKEKKKKEPVAKQHLRAVDEGEAPSKPGIWSFIHSARDLMKQDLPPVKWVVPDILPEGVTLFAGKSKIRKSWLCIGLCISVASGGVALGTVPVEQGRTLYLALEDNKRRIQRRVSKILNGDECPEAFDYATEFPRIDQGGAELLVEWIEANPDARLIVIDTLAKIRPRTRNQGYQEDYEAVEKIMEIANQYQIGIVIVHHTRKAEADDVVDEVNATTGLMGGVDGFLIMKTKRERFEGSMFITGREIEEERDISLRWDQNIHGWTMVDEGELAEEEGLSPERRLVLDVFARADGEALSLTRVQALLGKSKQATQNLLRSLVKDGRLEKAGRGLYKLAIHEPDLLEGGGGVGEEVVGTSLTPEEFDQLWAPDPDRERWTDAEEEEEEEE